MLRDRRRQPRRQVAQSGVLIWNESEARQIESTQVEDVSVHGIGLSCNRALPIGQTVWFEPLPGPIVKGVVRHCDIRENNYVLGVFRIEAERRRVERLPVRGEGTLDWYGDGGKTCSAPVVVRNASEFGLQLASPTPVPAGSAARLSGNTIGCVGTVCYCAPADGEFLVGLHFSQQPYDRFSRDYEGD